MGAAAERGVGARDSPPGSPSGSGSLWNTSESSSPALGGDKWWQVTCWECWLPASEEVARSWTPTLPTEKGQ